MILECNNLNLIYDANKEEKTFALRNINLEFESNKLIGVIGPSGSGKSSLLYALAGLKKPTTGFVSYKGKDIGKMSDGERADIRKKEFGFIFQRHFLIDYMDIIHNVLTPLNDFSDVSKKAALKLMEALRIEHLAYKKPYQLSVGQRQRVAIARALINNPKVVFADELTASLDHKSACEVMDVLNEYKKNALILVVTHDSSILTKADEVIAIRDGAVKESVSEIEVVV